MRATAVLLLTLLMAGAAPRPCETHAQAQAQAPTAACDCKGDGAKCPCGPACKCPSCTPPVAPASPKADPPKLDVKHRQFGQFVILLAETDGLRVKFVATTPGLERVPPEFLPQTDKSAVFHAKLGGTYTVLAYTARGDEPSEPTITTFTVDGPEPTPPPVPPPGPGPRPDPEPQPPTPPGTRTFWLVVVEDEDGPTADEAALLGDEAFWDSLKARGHSFRQYRPESPAALERNYVTQARKVGLPALLLVEREGGRPPAAAIRLPTAKADVEAAIKKAGGK